MSDYIETLHTNYNYRLSEFTGEYSDVESHYKATFHANISSPWMASRPNRLTWTRFYLLKAVQRSELGHLVFSIWSPNSDIQCFRFGVRTRTSSRSHKIDIWIIFVNQFEFYSLFFNVQSVGLYRLNYYYVKLRTCSSHSASGFAKCNRALKCRKLFKQCSKFAKKFEKVPEFRNFYEKLTKFRKYQTSPELQSLRTKNKIILVFSLQRPELPLLG